MNIIDKTPRNVLITLLYSRFYQFPNFESLFLKTQVFVTEKESTPTVFHQFQ